MGADERERNPRAVCFPPFEGSKGATAPGARAAQRAKDDGRAGDGDRRLRREVLRAAAETVSAQSRHEEIVREQSRGGARDSATQLEPAGRLSDSCSADARTRLRTDVGL